MHFLLWTAVLLAFFAGNVEAASDQKTICVNMIIKNESAVITRCLGSLKDFVDYWVIVDTGSTDGTQEIVREFLKDIPGELHERPWINFAHNRNEALDLAKGKADYILFIDADEVLKFDDTFKKPVLSKDCYYMKTVFGGTSYDRVGLIKDGQDWVWKGVVHEALFSDKPHTYDWLAGVYNYPSTDGARSKDPKKYLKDALLFEEDLKKDPNNAHNRFYLAQSYRDYGDHEKALINYQKRIAMGGWDEEVYWSMLQVALMQEELKYDDAIVEASYFNAWRYRPSRVEADYYLANHYRRKGDFKLAEFIAKRGLKKIRSNDRLFIQDWVYDYALLFEYSISAYWTGNFTESARASEELLLRSKLPDHYREQIMKNRNYALDKIAESMPRAA